MDVAPDGNKKIAKFYILFGYKIKMTCKNCGLRSCRCYESSDLDSEGEDIFYVSDLSSDEDYSSLDDSSDYSSSDNSSDEDYVYNSLDESSDDDDSD